MNKRLFIALSLSEQDKHNIAQWRQQNLPNARKAIIEENYHITLAFLGMVSASQHTKLIQVLTAFFQQRPIANSDHKANIIELKQLGYFQRAKIIHLCPANIPSWLHQLHQALAQQLTQLTFSLEQRSYQPHVSLIRAASKDQFQQYQQQLAPVNFNLNCSRVTLYQSMNSRYGVRYQAIKSWNI